jgi:predicted Zn finger-like uncharacterized protein
MRIECDKCHAKYSIADDKVRGKTFKIRCKKCANVIVVRDKAAAPDAAPVDEPLGWHIALGGETVGPLSDLEIRRRYDAGEIDRDTSVWQEGFEDWVPLGSVEAFADLPVPDVASDLGGRDEVISVRASSSPRVTDLTGQRNENSVLFSLENLQKLAGGGAEAAAAPAASRFTPSTQAPSSEGSGLIDIRQMRTMMGGPGEEEGPRHRDHDALPSFSGGGFGGLSAQPLVTEDVPLSAAGGMAGSEGMLQARSGGGGKSMILGASIIGIALVAAALIFKPAPPPPAPPPVVIAAAEVPEKKVEAPAEEPPPADAAADEGSAEEPESPESEKTPSRSGSSKRSTASRGSRHEAKPSAPSGSNAAAAKGDSDNAMLKDPAPSKSESNKPAKEEKATESSSGGGSVDVDVDCLLDPSLAKCKKSSGSSGSSKTGSSSGGSGKVDPNLPDSLTPTAIKAGIEGVKAGAERCGSKNGAAAGTKVAIKFQVNGATGTVTAATPLAENASNALGKCVASEAKKAKFPKFQKSSQAFEFRFRM